MRIVERVTLNVDNSVHQENNKFIEGAVSNIELSDVRAVYPLIKAINSDRLTRNFTFYPRESLTHGKSKTNPTGYYSFVYPHGKPILLEHRSSDSFFGGEASPPLGRVLYAGYKRIGTDESQTIIPLKPGTLEGSGHLVLVPCISDETAIPKVLGGAYHTVSIGARVEKVIESISGIDIAKARREGGEVPMYDRGQTYKIDGREQLSYWTMGPIGGMECSYVNVPSDEYAGTLKADIGMEGVRLLVGQKTVGTKEFNFYDIKTGERVDWLSSYADEFALDESLDLIDSIKVGENIWYFDSNKMLCQESASICDEFVKEFVSGFEKTVSYEKAVEDVFNEVLNE